MKPALRKSLLILSSVLALSALLHAREARSGGTAQIESGGEFNSCVESFFDAAQYGWLAYRNNCSESVKVFFRSNNPPHSIDGAITLAPGGKDSTGRSRKEVNDAGGLSVAICRPNYHPIDPQGANWRDPHGQYRCKKLY